MRSTKPGQIPPQPSLAAQQEDLSHDSFGVSAFTDCLVDADSAAIRGTGRARRKALGVSALVQFCTIAAILIVPLFATGSRLILRPTNFVPLPPYGGAPRHDTAHSPQLPMTNHPTTDFFPRPDQIVVPTLPPIAIDSFEDPELTVGTTAAANQRIVLGGGNSDGRPNILIGDGPGPQPPRPDPVPVAPPRRPVAVSQGVELALLTHRVEPTYPVLARQMHKEGTVELRATISADGEVKDVQIISGDPMLAKTARDAVSQWRFRPTLLNGVAVEVVTFITVNFHIGQ
jgi:protein TonB